MAVIINDFEVIIDQPETTADGSGEQTEKQAATQLTPQDVHDVLRYFTEREARVLAH